jgi:hypothetical protein
VRRKIILFLILFFLFLVLAQADEYYKFVKITCTKEVGFLEIQATGMHNIRDFVWGESLTKLNLKALETLRKKYGLYLGSYLMGKITNNCKLFGKMVKTEIVYDRPKERGQCSANPSAILNLWVDDVELIKNVTFHEDCWNVPSVYKISLEFINGEPFLDVFLREGSKESFRWGIIWGANLKNKEPITMEFIIKNILKEQ